jgi:hypothetical protein
MFNQGLQILMLYFLFLPQAVKYIQNMVKGIMQVRIGRNFTVGIGVDKIILTNPG